MNRAQNAVFDLMKASSFNKFDGDKIVALLEAHTDLWIGAVWGTFTEFHPLLALRDIWAGYYNADTLMVMAVKGKEEELIRLVSRKFRADEIGFLEDKKAERMLSGRLRDQEEQGRVLRVWWD